MRGSMKQVFIILTTMGAFEAMDFVYSGEFSHSCWRGGRRNNVGAYGIRPGGNGNDANVLHLSILQKSKKLSFRQASGRNPDCNHPKNMDPRHKHSGMTIILQEPHRLSIRIILGVACITILCGTSKKQKPICANMA